MSNNNTLNRTKIDNALYQKNAKAKEGSTNPYHIPNKVNTAIENIYIRMKKKLYKTTMSQTQIVTIRQ